MEMRGEEGRSRKEIGTWLLKAELRSLQMEKLRGLLDYLVLRLLKNQSMHGYGILSAVKKLYGYYPAPSTLYPLLSSFEKKGYLESRFEFRNGRPRRVYDITSDGKIALFFVEDLLNHVMSLASLK
ncbi:MAG: helix-turn-helix transcriptional regulator [Candidatus Bathyarchaeota archaeon]|nr:MAG: helix-turn-helix transcriptional regulator [Candidatus Bathyarchaeota archaeon]